MRNGQLSNKEVEVSRKGNQQKLRESVSAPGSFFPENLPHFFNVTSGLVTWRGLSFQADRSLWKDTNSNSDTNRRERKCCYFNCPGIIPKITKGWLNDDDSVL